METVVQFPKKETLVWVCACGCSTFCLLDTGYAECSFCGGLHDVENAGWAEHVSEHIDRFEGETFKDTQGNGSVDFAKAQARRAAMREDVAMVIVADEAGRLLCWFNVSNEDHRQLCLEKISDATDLLKRYNFKE